MDVNEQYLKWYATPIEGEPEEIPLNGYEANGTNVIAIDDSDHTYLSVRYTDEYPNDTHPLDILKGTEKRSTFVMAKRDFSFVGPVGYKFSGLIILDDLRTWYRTKMGIVDPVVEVVEITPDGEE